MLFGTRSNQHHIFTYIERHTVMASLLSSLAPYLLANTDILNVLSSFL